MTHEPSLVYQLIVYKMSLYLPKVESINTHQPQHLKDTNQGAQRGKTPQKTSYQPHCPISMSNIALQNSNHLTLDKIQSTQIL